MKRVIATIELKRVEDGGRRQPIPPMVYGCPIFFEDIPVLSGHGYDCRILVNQHKRSIAPGEVAEKITMLFLSADEVMPHLRPGVRFRLWEGKTIGTGMITAIESD